MDKRYILGVVDDVATRIICQQKIIKHCITAIFHSSSILSILIGWAGEYGGDVIMFYYFLLADNSGCYNDIFIIYFISASVFQLQNLPAHIINFIKDYFKYENKNKIIIIEKKIFSCKFKVFIRAKCFNIYVYVDKFLIDKWFKFFK